jgi:hypothetical protein
LGLRIWDIWDLGYLEFEIWDIWDLEFGIFGIWNIWNLEYLEFGIFGISHRDIEFSNRPNPKSQIPIDDG